MIAGVEGKPRSLRRSTLFAFAGPAIPYAAVGLPMVVYLPPYYAGTLGLDLAAVGLIFMLVRAIDLPIDPVLGHMMDATRSRFGRYRPWLAAGGLVMALGAYAVFMAGPGLTALDAFARLMLLFVGMSLVAVALLGWGATLSSDYDGRSRVFGWFMAAQVLGMILVLMLPPLASQLSGREGAAPGIHAMGWFIIILAPLTTIWMALRVPERAAPARRPEASRAELAALARNPLVRRLLWLDILTSASPGITGAMFLFYFEHRLGFAAAAASSLLLVYFVSGFAAVPFWTMLARRIGKHRAAAAACLTFGVTHAGLSLLPPNGGFAMAAGAMGIAGLPYAAAPFLLRAMLADVADADRLETGLDRNALLQAVLTTTMKIGYALPIAIIYPVLSLIGFDPRPSGANSSGAILGMTLLFVGGPVLLMLLAAASAWRWPLDAAAHADIQARLAARAVPAAAE